MADDTDTPELGRIDDRFLELIERQLEERITQRVAFASAATNLVANDSNGRIDIFVCDRAARTLDLVSVATGGLTGDGDSILPAISADGRFVAFKSTAEALVPDDYNDVVDVFVRDHVAARTERISVGKSGGDADDVSFPPTISHDGRFVSFGSLATNLVSGDSNATSNTFVRDRQTGITLLVDVNEDGEAGNRGTLDTAAAIAGDGTRVGFVSLAANLVGPTSDVANVFVVPNPFLAMAARHGADARSARTHFSHSR
jgi:Tol biopolymer transport system component